MDNDMSRRVPPPSIDTAPIRARLQAAMDSAPPEVQRQWVADQYARMARNDAEGAAAIGRIEADRAAQQADDPTTAEVVALRGEVHRLTEVLAREHPGRPVVPGHGEPFRTGRTPG